MAPRFGHPTIINSRSFCYLLLLLSSISSISFVFWSHCSSPHPCPSLPSSSLLSSSSFNLLSYPSAWNHLSFSSNPPKKLLKIALFVKRWPHRDLAGGLERHALTLHLALARRGHELHIFTTNSSVPKYLDANIKFHLTPPSPAGHLNQALVFQQFQSENSSQRPFDVVHTESVSLFHARARNLSNLAVSWHGIAYETIHSDIVQELLRSPGESKSSALTERLSRVVDEVKFFQDYAHHVATSDHVGDVLKRIYMIPDERVHIIVNGVDENVYRVDASRGKEFRRHVGVPEDAGLVIGMAGRLVKDKGHPVMFEALKQIFMEDERFKRSVLVVIAGDGPWGSRYKTLGSNVIVLGPLDQPQLAKFYNSLDVFVNPTVRAQGLDHTFIEAMLCGVSVAGTRFASITGSLIVDSEDCGYTFLPTVESLKHSLYKIFKDGRGIQKQKGRTGRTRAERLFTATKMAAAYERLFLCISQDRKRNEAEGDNIDYCKYPLSGE